MKTSKRIVFLAFFLLTSLTAFSQRYLPDNKTYLYLYTSKIPAFPGGYNGLMLFLKNNVRWPDNNLDVRGTVLLSFTILKDGHISNIKVEKSLMDKFDNEAKRVISLMPKWIPGEADNKKVNVKVYFPFDFKIYY